MKFQQYGYKNKTIEVREMTMADIAITVSQAMIRNNCKDMEIRIVDLFAGEVETYKGMDEFLMVDWSGEYKVNVYGWASMHSNVTNTDYIKIIISDDYYEESESLRIKPLMSL